MSTKPVRGITVTRWIRRALAVILAWNLGMGIYDLTTGHIFGLASFICVLGLAAVMTYQTKVIRRVERANRPRPDYSAIAAMEREVYGETFEHDGAVKPEASGSVAELHAMMDDLAERGTVRRSHCARGHDDQLWVQGRGQMCPKCDQMHRDHQTTTEPEGD